MMGVGEEGLVPVEMGRTHTCLIGITWLQARPNNVSIHSPPSPRVTPHLLLLLLLLLRRLSFSTAQTFWLICEILNKYKLFFYF